ncbi:unnamed protein product [Bursaphelenchus xylophilus]|uniref:(pine wood nematode) hypothetical protein n=1 Tax=Bursaphelenchus xylophilus TaxID=6326 RepID=A0A1I7SA32_BURXY|nr:unnamed protein product [Bursaphelenchus xylophilus]CAG9131785.1 unnamed protein product [Bursaphelenchus xylophilus]
MAQKILPDASYEHMDIRFDMNIASRTNQVPEYEIILNLKLKSGETKQYSMKADDIKLLDGELTKIVSHFPKCRRYR